jgi:hypothetical protein
LHNALWHAFFFSCPLGMFFIAHTLLAHEYFWRKNHNTFGVFLVNGENMKCVTLSVRVSIFLWVYVNLNLGSMKLLST